jgi:RNA polymerase sigma factor (sigma-70 family)
VQAEVIGTPAADETSDAVLLLRTREGDSEAFGSLYLRHVGAARVLARQLARDPSEADELVAESFTRVLSVLQRGGGPEAAVRPYLLSTMRRLNVDRRVAERKTEPTDDLTAHDPGEPFIDLPADELERSIVSTAFASLPERWRLVLWHTEVEGLPPAQVAPLLGISPNATAALAVRARAGLRDAYLSAHVSNASEPGCREIGPSLGGYVRGTLSRRERAAVDAHLDGCARCSAAVLELSDTAATMRAVIGPLILGSAVLAYREGVLALGAHAIPSAALLHSAAAAGAHVAGGSGGGGSGVAGLASRPVWQLIGAASVAGAVAVGAVAAFALTGGSPSRPAASGPVPTPRSTSGQTPGGTSTPVPSPSPSPSSTAPTSTSLPTVPTGPAQPGPGANPVDQTTPSSSTSSTSSTAPLPALQPATAGLVTVVSVGDLVAGRDNVLQVTTDNPNPTAVSEAFSVTLPSGIAVSPMTAAVRGGGASDAAYRSLAASASPAPGTCTPTDHGATCSLGVVGAGARAEIRIPVKVEAGFTTDTYSVVVTSTSQGRQASVTKQGTLTVTPDGVSALWSDNGRFQVEAGGAALLSCQSDATPVKGCAEAEARTFPGHQDDDDWRMQPLNDAGKPWTTSSTAQIALPKGSQVAHAWLSWSGSGFDPGTTFKDTATIAGPDGARTTVKADTLQPVALSASGNGYVATTDVTKLVRAQGGGTWTVGDIDLVEGRVGNYAGWSLTVVTTSSTSPVRDVTVLNGPWAITGNSAAAAWKGRAPGLDNHSAQITLVAWEGDADLTGDALLVHANPVAALDAPKVTDNIAASAAMGAKRALNFGVDVRQLNAPIGPGDQMQVVTNGDNWILGMLVVSTGSEAAGA